MLKIGVQSTPWFSIDDPDGSIRFIKECGFDCIDFNIDTNLPSDKIRSGELTEFFNRSVEELCEYYRPLKEALCKYGVTVSQMHAPHPLFVRGLDEVNQYMIDTVEKICGICAYLECPAVVVHPVGRSIKEKEQRINLNMYRAMIPGAKKYGVKLCLENLFRSFNGRAIEGPCSDVFEACWYLDKLNEEAGEDIFGFCLDIGHANVLGRNLYNQIMALGKRLTILHIHDNDGNGDLHMMPYTYTKHSGKDLICDWEGFINGLRNSGYEGALSFETYRTLGSFPRELWPEVLRLIRSTGHYWAKRICE